MLLRKNSKNVPQEEREPLRRTTLLIADSLAC